MMLIDENANIELYTFGVLHLSLTFIAIQIVVYELWYTKSHKQNLLSKFAWRYDKAIIMRNPSTLNSNITSIAYAYM